jgi:protein ImuA
MPLPDPKLAALRRSLAQSERRHGVLPTGFPGIDQVLPEGGLRAGALHQIVAAPDDAASAAGFAVLLLARLGRQGPVLWCRATDDLYAPGLIGLGLAPERVILVRARRPADRLWAMEEGLRAGGLAAVLGEPDALDLTASRRLQLAAEGSATPCFVLTPSGTGGSTVAVTRWHVASAAGVSGGETPDFGRRRARWLVNLERCRGAVPGAGEAGFGRWLIEPGGTIQAPKRQAASEAA